MTPTTGKGKKFAVAKPTRMGRKSAGTSMARASKPPKMSLKAGKSMKGC